MKGKSIVFFFLTVFIWGCTTTTVDVDCPDVEGSRTFLSSLIKNIDNVQWLRAHSLFGKGQTVKKNLTYSEARQIYKSALHIHKKHNLKKLYDTSLSRGGSCDKEMGRPFISLYRDKLLHVGLMKDDVTWNLYYLEYFEF